MKHPDPEKCEELGNLFLELGKKHKNGVVDMKEGSWRDRNKCGTVACHAGWYAVANAKFWDLGNYNYLNAADDMAKELGFSNYDKLENWAAEYDYIWGNTYGNHMFHSEEAFGFRTNKTIKLSDIGNHWLGVTQRIREAQGD